MMQHLKARKSEAEVLDCIHCGTPFRATATRRQFCCSGCEFVYGLIREEGLERFYDIKNGNAAPVNTAVFTPRDYAWLEEMTASFSGQSEGCLRLEIQGISCLGCVWLIEKLFLRLPGALDVEVSPARAEIQLRWKTSDCDILGFARQIQSFGYLLGPPQTEPSKTLRPHSGLVKRLGVCGAFAMNAMLFSIPRYLGMDESFVLASLFDGLAFLFSTLSFLAGGTYFIRRALEGLRMGMLQIDLPIALGLIAAYAGSAYAWFDGRMSLAYFDFVSTFTFLMLLGRWTQNAALERNRKQLLRADAGTPRITLAGKEASAAELEIGTIYTIKTGQSAPVRSKLLSASAILGLEWINGESEPRTTRIGQLVPSGALNRGSEVIELQAMERWEGSLLSLLTAITPRATGPSIKLQRFIGWYLFAVVATAVAGFIQWQVSGAPFAAALQVFISVLVVSCPCASGVALPFLDELATSALRSCGIYVRESSLWSRLLSVRNIVFDKTGTLTLETMALTDPRSLTQLGKQQRATLLTMVAESLHPVACALREFLMRDGVRAVEGSPPPFEVVGMGIQLASEQGVWKLGRPGWSGPENVEADSVFSCDGQVLASFGFLEQVRTGAAEETAWLRQHGFRIFIASGDRQEKVDRIASSMGLSSEGCRGELTPVQKAEWVRELPQGTLMIGDGANDSLAFNESLCTGTPAIDRGLLEKKSDFYFLGQGLDAIRRLLETAAQRRAGIRAVLTFTIAYNIVAVGASLAGWMSPVVAAVAMPLSSFVSLGIAGCFAHRR